MDSNKNPSNKLKVTERAKKQEALLLANEIGQLSAQEGLINVVYVVAGLGRNVTLELKNQELQQELAKIRESIQTLQRTKNKLQEDAANLHSLEIRLKEESKKPGIAPICSIAANNRNYTQLNKKVQMLINLKQCEQQAKATIGAFSGPPKDKILAACGQPLDSDIDVLLKEILTVGEKNVKVTEQIAALEAELKKKAAQASELAQEKSKLSKNLVQPATESRDDIFFEPPISESARLKGSNPTGKLDDIFALDHGKVATAATMEHKDGYKEKVGKLQDSVKNKAKEVEEK